jgi:hypothetical protein
MIKENTNIKVGWFMKKYNKFQVRLGKFDDKSKEWITSKATNVLLFLIHIETDTQQQLIIL